MNYPQAIVRAKAVAEKHAPARFFAKAKGDVGELYIYDAIGGGMWSEGVTPKAVADSLAEMKNAKSLAVYINSPGGDVFDGVAIYNEIRRFPGKKTVHVDGIAASAASMIAMAGDEIVMAHNATMMIHEAWGMAIGNAADMRETADLLDKITDTAVLGSYARTGHSKEKLREWMKAETWMTAEEAVDRKFADSISEAPAQAPEASAAPLLAAYAKTPESIAAPRRTTGVRLATDIEETMSRLKISPAAGSRRSPGGPGPTQPPKGGKEAR